jgi:ubiquinone/menaquinone biosynthesis C-methylase UbiE
MDNNYHARVFLSGLLGKPDYMNSRIWKEHQEMQARFLLSKGLTPDSTVLDVGCGPLRLGVALIPRLTRGWYYGVDINADTLKAGRKVLSDAGVEASRVTLVCSADFDTALVDRPIDIAFSNSLFSHLSLNSVLMCLKRVRGVIKEDGR